MKKFLFVFIAGVTVVACSPETTAVVTDSNDEGMPKTAIGEGKVVYLKKCQKCHDLKKVEDFTAAEWKNILPKMAVKAELTEEEHEQVSAYINWELVND